MTPSLHHLPSGQKTQSSAETIMINWSFPYVPSGQFVGAELPAGQ